MATDDRHYASGIDICVFAISPTLLPLHRLLYYLSLGLALLYPTPPPLIKGAFAYCLTTSAIASIYSIVLAIPHPHDILGPQNLDIFPLWSILASAAISLPMFLSWNRNVAQRYNPVRPIVRIWGILITFGTACAFVNLRQFWKAGTTDPDSSLEQCQRRTSQGTLRDIHHVQIIKSWYLIGPNLHHVQLVTPAMTFIPLTIGALSCLFYPSKKNGDAAAMSAPELTISSDLLDDRMSLSVKLFSRVYDPTCMLVLWCSPTIWIVVLVLNEMFLLQRGVKKLPVMEEIYEVGQWGVWAGLGLVMLAGIVDYFTGKKKTVTILRTREGIEGDGSVGYGA